MTHGRPCDPKHLSGRQDTMSRIQLAAHEKHQLLRAQEALLSPLAAEDPAKWQLRANRAIRRFLGADRSVFIRPPAVKDFPFVTTDDTDPAFEEGLRRLAAESPHGARYGDSFLQRIHRRRMALGKTALHMEDLVAPEERATAPSFQEIFRPCGMRHLVALTTATPGGTVTQSFGFDRRDSPGYSAEGFQKLRLLVPAFLAGVRASSRWIDRWDELFAVLDRIPQPLALFDARGRRLHANRPLVQLLSEQPTDDDLFGAIDKLAEVFADRLRGPVGAQDEVSATVGCRLERGGRGYRLSAVYGPSPAAGEEKTILVHVDRAGTLLPEATALQERHGLTPRQAEVALLLARGHSDKAIARRLDISWHTARSHVRNVLSKLSISSRAQVVVTLLSTDENHPGSAGDPLT